MYRLPQFIKCQRRGTSHFSSLLFYPFQLFRLCVCAWWVEDKQIKKISIYMTNYIINMWQNTFISICLLFNPAIFRSMSFYGMPKKWMLCMSSQFCHFFISFLSFFFLSIALSSLLSLCFSLFARCGALFPRFLSLPHSRSPIFTTFSLLFKTKKKCRFKRAFDWIYRTMILFNHCIKHSFTLYIKQQMKEIANYARWKMQSTRKAFHRCIFIIEIVIQLYALDKWKKDHLIGT